MSDNEKLAYFRRGLNAHLGLEIDKADGAMTYERAVGLAAKIESAVNTLANSKSPTYSNTLGKSTNNYKGKFNSSTTQPGYGSAGTGNQSTVTGTGPTAQVVTNYKLNELLTEETDEPNYNYNEEGEGIISLNAVFKKLSQEERKKLMKEGRCFFCREVGHITKNCPKRSKNNSKLIGSQGKGEARQQ